jgi:hypothetical protein
VASLAQVISDQDIIAARFGVRPCYPSVIPTALLVLSLTGSPSPPLQIAAIAEGPFQCASDLLTTIPSIVARWSIGEIWSAS